MVCGSSWRRGLPLVPGIVLAAMAVHAQQPQTPVFRSSVELTSIDVGVVDDRGRPVMGLVPAEFTVQIDGVARRGQVRGCLGFLAEVQQSELHFRLRLKRKD